MEDDLCCPNNISIYLLPIVSFFFVYLDVTEMFKVIDSWNYSLSNYNKNMFDQCIKFPIITRSGFTFFSLMAAFSAFFLSVWVAINMDVFVKKFLNCYVQMNYFIFGPYMLGAGILGVVFWDKILYHCDLENNMAKSFSIAEFINLIVCLSLSLMITISMAIYKSISIYVDSISDRETGSKLLRRLFWYFAFRNRGQNIYHPNRNYSDPSIIDD